MLDVVTGNLEIPYVTLAGHLDSAQGIVADMVVVDVDLMQAQRIQKNSIPAIVIDVAVCNDHVSVSDPEMDAVVDLTDQNRMDYSLHGLAELQPVSPWMIPHNLQSGHRGHAFKLPDVGLERVGKGGSFMAASKPERRSLSPHDHPGAPPAATQPCRAVFAAMNRDG